MMVTAYKVEPEVADRQASKRQIAWNSYFEPVTGSLIDTNITSLGIGTYCIFGPYNSTTATISICVALTRKRTSSAAKRMA